MKQTTCFDFMGRSTRIYRRPPRRGACARRRCAPAGRIRCGGAANKTVDHNSNRFVLCEINTRRVQAAYSHSEMPSRSFCGMAARELGSTSSTAGS